MSDRISVADIVITWFLFWILTLAGLGLFAGTVLVPMWDQQRKLIAEYKVVQMQIERVQEEVDHVNDQVAALWVDPQYTERIARSELNLRKSGYETLSIEPLPVVPEMDQNGRKEEKIDLPADFSDRWWYRPFMDARHRQWFLILAGGLIVTAIVTAIASKDRRLRALGF